MTTRARAAAQMVQMLDSPFLRALTEPARLQVLRVLLVHGPADIATLAEHLPQDRSVVSRHLQHLQRAGIVRGLRDGRRRVFELDGAGFLAQLETILAQARRLAPDCCPPTPRPRRGSDRA
jgi:DNA-binding transcriptional ArsR family regulator